MRESVPGSGLGFIRDFIRFSNAAGNPHHSEVVAELGTADGIDGMEGAAISMDGRRASRWAPALSHLLNFAYPCFRLSLAAAVALLAILVEQGGEFLGHFGMLVEQVRLLGGIGVEVVELRDVVAGAT